MNPNISYFKLGLAIFGGCILLGGTSLQAEWNVLEEAHEIVDIGSVYLHLEQPVLTYKSADDPNAPGDTQVPDDVWPGYTPPSPYIKNTTRNLQFNESEFLASPDAPLGTTTYATTADGYSWAFMSKAINSMWPYNSADYSGLSAVNTYYAGNFETTPSAEVVKVTANFKGQNMKFWANQNGVAPGTPGAVALDRYFVIDQWGNEYIMHASGQTDQSQVAAAFAAAVLPVGWTKETRQLTEDVILEPAQGADGSFHYLIFRDSADNTYHQTKWSDTGSLSAQVAGMPIWGGQDDNILAGDVGGILGDLIHGADGNDTLMPGLGDNEVWGDAGFDTVVLVGNRGDYSLLSVSPDFTELVTNGLGYTQTIYFAEMLQFDDGAISIEAFAVPEPQTLVFMAIAFGILGYGYWRKRVRRN